MKDKPIGVFDSGVGGLTVFDALARSYPAESLLYFGDTGRYPYGVRSKQVIVAYARQLALYLQALGSKFIVVACNSASAMALDEVRAAVAVEVIGVVEPGARAAVEATRSGRIGVIGTEATIGSGTYTEAIRRLAPEAQVFSRPCPLFVALAEEGYAGHAVTRTVAAEYLAPLQEEGIDTLVLGCTHYPLLKNDIQTVVGPDVRLVDSAHAVAQAVGARLIARNQHRETGEHPVRRFCVTDTPERFRRVGARFLKRAVNPVEVVDIETLAHPHEIPTSN